MRRALFVMVAIVIGLIASVLSSWAIEWTRDDRGETWRGFGASVEGVGSPISPAEIWPQSPFRHAPSVYRRESSGVAVWTYQWTEAGDEFLGPIGMLLEIRTGWPIPCLRLFSESSGSGGFWNGETPLSGVRRGGVDVGAKPGVNGNVLRLPVDPVWGGLAVNTAVYASWVGVVMLIWRWRRRVSLARRGRCRSCGYPWGASVVCTECGAPRGGAVKQAGVIERTVFRAIAGSFVGVGATVGLAWAGDLIGQRVMGDPFRGNMPSSQGGRGIAGERDTALLAMEDAGAGPGARVRNWLVKSEGGLAVVREVHSGWPVAVMVRYEEAPGFRATNSVMVASPRVWTGGIGMRGMLVPVQPIWWAFVGQSAVLAGVWVGVAFWRERRRWRRGVEMGP